MAFVSGTWAICPTCGETTDLAVIRERFADDGLFYGEQLCRTCGASMLYSRRPETEEEIAMAKSQKRASKRDRKLTRPASAAKRSRWSASRSRTIKGNGSVSTTLAASAAPAASATVGEAMRLAVEALGDVAVDAQLAPGQLRELGTCYEEIARRHAAFDAKAEEAKTAKKSLELAQELLLERVKAFTHPAPLPLFDAVEAEADREAMVDASDEASAWDRKSE